jgi:hypothetical protein
MSLGCYCHQQGYRYSKHKDCFAERFGNLIVFPIRSKICCVITVIFHVFVFVLTHYGPGVDSASKRNEYQEYFLGVKVDGA